MKFRLSALLGFLLYMPLLKGQNNAQLEVIETFPVNAKVVGVLEDDNSLAILQITKVDTGKHNLEVGSEILADFYFTTKPIKNEAQLKGLKSGDYISVRLHAKKQALTGSWQYTAFHYIVFNPKELNESQIGAPPEK